LFVVVRHASARATDAGGNNLISDILDQLGYYSQCIHQKGTVNKKLQFDIDVFNLHLHVF
jgi:hypothetical protein